MNGYDSFNTASVALELITFVKHMGFEAQFRSELESIYQGTIPAAQELYVSFAQSSPFRRLVMGERHVQLNWPDLQVPESERQLFITSPTHRQWLAAFIQLQLTQSFPDLVSEDQIKEQLQATKLAWLQSRFAQFDGDSNDLLSVDEFAKFASFARPLAMNLDFEQADKNDDKSVSVEELFEYLESESPLINRY